MAKVGADMMADDVPLVELQRRYSRRLVELTELAKRIRAKGGDDTKWLPIKAVDTDGYSCERIRQLCAAGKIRSRMVGGRREVDNDSLSSYLARRRSVLKFGDDPNS